MISHSVGNIAREKLQLVDCAGLYRPSIAFIIGGWLHVLSQKCKLTVAQMKYAPLIIIAAYYIAPSTLKDINAE
ncbi:MAG: hypothetical protein ACJA2D_001289 [Pseudohongiellaceae bacterium]|jgi:hypothetical protein